MPSFNEVLQERLQEQAVADCRDDIKRLCFGYGTTLKLIEHESEGENIRTQVVRATKQFTDALLSTIDEHEETALAVTTTTKRRPMENITKSRREIVEKTMQADPSISREAAEAAARHFDPGAEEQAGPVQKSATVETVESEARKLQAQEPDLDYPQAAAKVIEQRPDLAAAAREEQPQL